MEATPRIILAQNFSTKLRIMPVFSGTADTLGVALSNPGLAGFV